MGCCASLCIHWAAQNRKLHPFLILADSVYLLPFVFIFTVDSRSKLCVRNAVRRYDLYGNQLLVLQESGFGYYLVIFILHVSIYLFP
jgi:hypothetical protein